MTISVRHAVRDEWPEVLKIHRRAIHEIAAADYPIEVLTAWGPPITDQDLTRMLAEFDAKPEHGHIVIVAEVNGSLAGFGEIVPEKNELLAIYVNPDFGRQGLRDAPKIISFYFLIYDMVMTRHVTSPITGIILCLAHIPGRVPGHPSNYKIRL